MHARYSISSPLCIHEILSSSVRVHEIDSISSPECVHEILSPVLVRARDSIFSSICVREILSLVQCTCTLNAVLFFFLSFFFVLFVVVFCLFLPFFFFVMSTAPRVAIEFLFLAMNVRADCIQVLLRHA